MRDKKTKGKNERPKILAVYDSFIKREHFENGLKNLECEIKLVELDERALWETNEIKEYRGSPEQLMKDVEDTDILLVHLAPVTEGLIEHGKRLKLIGCCRGGPVNVNVKAASARGIAVINTPGRNAMAVAELTIGFMFALARKTCEDNLLIKEDRMPKEQDFYEGIELGGKTLGLVGFGRVGREVEKRAKALGMNVIVFDPYVEDRESVSIEAVFRESDFVSVHARLTKETEGMIDEGLIRLMKKSSYFINTSRAEIVKQDALEGALREKRIVGAALDVVRLGERYPVNPLEFYTFYDGDKAPDMVKMDNVIITPHIGGLTKETRQRSVEILTEDVRRFLSGEKPLNVVK